MVILLPSLQADADEFPVAHIPPAAVLEPRGGNASAAVPVLLSDTTGSPVTLTWRTVPGTAAPGLDYEETTGTLTIAAGTLEGVIEVPLHGDALAEEDETVVLEITSITGATAPDRVILTIRDTEPHLAVIAGRAIDGAEGFEPASVAIRGWQAAPPAEVAWTTASIQKIAANEFGFAVTGDDFNPATGTFHLTTASAADPALVHAPDDAIFENAETFSVLWQLPPPAVAGSWGQRLVHATRDPPLSSTDGRWAAFYDEDTGDIALFRREQSALRGWAEFRRLQPEAAYWEGEWLRLRKGNLMFWDKRLQEVLVFGENHGGPDNWGLHSRIPVTGNSLSFDGDVFVQGPSPVSVRERNWKGEWQVTQTLDMAEFDLSKPLTLSVDGTVIAVCGVVGQAPGDRVVLRIFERTPGGEARWTRVRDWMLTDASGGVAGGGGRGSRCHRGGIQSGAG